MKICNEIQQIIAELEFNQVIDDKSQLQHLETCKDCQAYKTACDEMNQAMLQLSDFDADDGLVESTLNSIVNLQEEAKEINKPKHILNTQWASALAASFMLVSLIALFPYNSISNFGLLGDDSSEIKSVAKEEERAIKKRKEALPKKKALKTSDFEFYDVDVTDEIVQKQRRTPSKLAISSSLRINNNGVGQVLVPPKISRKDIAQDFDYYKTEDKNDPSSILNEKPIDSSLEKNKQQIVGNEIAESVIEYEDDQDRMLLDSVVVTGSRISVTDLESAVPVTIISREGIDTDYVTENSAITSIGKLNKAKEKYDLDSRNSGLAGDSVNATSQRQDIEPKSKIAGTLNSSGRKNAALEQGLADTLEFIQDGSVKSPVFEVEEAVVPIATLTLAQQYLTKMSSLDNIKYQTASGYWANTYLPGDSSMRLLEASLANNTSLALTNSISQNIQPFDYPANSALAVYLNSDVANVQSQQPTRMRIQVGIQASNRQGGQRAAMNIALVFDLSNKTPEYAASMKALLLELLKSKQPDDNISLTVAGVAGGNLIEPKDFRHGQIQVVMNNLFSNKLENTQQKTKGLNLNQAIQLASAQLINNDDASATLGSSVIMLFSANTINNITILESMVHANALKGITLSTVALGQDNHQQLKQLALAGQGHARILQSTNDAKRVIDEELLASSRAVARALRLRIRLAKGVKLIEVLDSYNLNEKQSQRVRDAEQSLDKRLSKNLGIRTDRGEDEEGIQIVIPSFFAGDTHVILLDVVATDAKAIADVTLRYKDLLYLRNAISRKQLNLENNPKALGPLQYNVMKNVLASKFAKSIKQAGKHIRQGNHSQALTLLLNMQNLYQSLRKQFPVWNKDQEILNDEKLLQEYINILHSLSSNDVQKINYIVDSMQYISWRKHITQTQ